MESLALGNYNIAIVSETGAAATTFTVAVPTVPATGDSTSVALIAGMIAVALAGVLFARKQVMSK